MMIRVRRIEQNDGKRRVDFLDHGDGFFSYEAMREAVDDVPELGPQIYWKCELQSGLFASLEDAERDALLAVPWLRSSDKQT